MISLSSPRLFFEFRDITDELDALLRDILSLWPYDEFHITSIYRTPEEDTLLKASGIHTSIPHRALDASIHPMALTLLDQQRLALNFARRINRRWIYDPRRPRFKVIVAKQHGTGPHLHIQTHPRTERAK